LRVAMPIGRLALTMTAMMSCVASSSPVIGALKKNRNEMSAIVRSERTSMPTTATTAIRRASATHPRSSSSSKDPISLLI
jgi:hypothetical protein